MLRSLKARLSPADHLPDNGTGIRAPAWLRAIVRAIVRGDEIWLAVLAAGIGAACLVAGIVTVVQSLHHLLFALEGHDVSGAAAVDLWPAALVPVAGGGLMAALGWLLGRFPRLFNAQGRPHRPRRPDARPVPPQLLKVVRKR